MVPGQKAWPLRFNRRRVAAVYDVPEVRAFLETIEESLRKPDVEVLHSGRNIITAVRLPLSGGRTIDLVIKEFRPRGLQRLRTLFGASKAARAWRGAATLAEAGLPTASPVAFIERRRRGSVERAYFIAERIVGAVEIRAFFGGLAEADLRPLLAALARTVRDGHDRGILHGDLSDGNVLAARDADGTIKLFFLDTNRVRRRKKIGDSARAKNLIRLGVPPALRTEFLTMYAGERGLRPSFARRYARAKSAFEGWLRFKKKTRLRRWARKLKLQ